MRMKFLEPKDDDKEIKKLRSKRLSEGKKDIKEVLHYQGFLYILKIICLELISRYHNNTFAGYFGIKKMQKLIAQNYDWSTLQKDVKAYVKDHDICLASKAVCYKSYRDF